MKLPSGEFWFDAPKSVAEAEAISKALKEAGVLDEGLVTRCWRKAADFWVRAFPEGERDLYWNSIKGYKGLPPTKVVFTFKTVVQLDCTIEEPPEWKSPKLGSKWKKMEGYKKGDTYLLAHVGHREAALINMGTGQKLKSDVKVSDMCNISQKEWNEITAGYEFQPV